MTLPHQPVIIGAGPAGIRAAETLALAGTRPILIDEAPRWGGQIYRQQPKGFRRPLNDLYGFEAVRAKAVLDAMGGFRNDVDYRPDTLVWNVDPGKLSLHGPEGHSELAFNHLVLATGATDRILPVPGWTLPGVFSLGGSQVALKYQACSIGERVVFAGTGPLLYLVAYQYAKAGARVAAVLDTSGISGQIAAIPGLATLPGMAAKGLYYIARLRLWGIPIHTGCELRHVEGDDQVTGVVWRRGTVDHRTECDAVAIGYGLRSETQLADLAGCAFDLDESEQSWSVRADEVGRTSVSGVYVAGDGASILGARAAEASGHLAALALLDDAGLGAGSPGRRRARRELSKAERFQRGLRKAFPLPADWAATVDDDLIICRCERITAGAIRQSVTLLDAPDLNRSKAINRAGMGRCQGRMCSTACALLMKQAGTQPGRLRAQAPIKPIPLNQFDTGGGE